jgi:hypothetical protein
MTRFMPILVRTPYTFEIGQDRRGLWQARDKGGLTGGVFLTQLDAFRFALFEANGDRSHVSVVPAASFDTVSRARPSRAGSNKPGESGEIRREGSDRKQSRRGQDAAHHQNRSRRRAPAGAKGMALR